MNNLEKFNARELTSKHAWLMDEIEKLPPGTEISPVKKKEALELQADLRRRLYLLLKGGVLPILAIATKAVKKEEPTLGRQARENCLR